MYAFVFEFVFTFVFALVFVFVFKFVFTFVFALVFVFVFVLLSKAASRLSENKGCCPEYVLFSAVGCLHIVFSTHENYTEVGKLFLQGCYLS